MLQMTTIAPSPPVNLGLVSEQMEQVAYILKITAHPTRIAIGQRLAAPDSRSVGEIRGRLGGAEQSLTSHHLATMKRKGSLSSSRSSKNVGYPLKMRAGSSVIQGLAGCPAL